jgi:hypothetical protein
MIAFGEFRNSLVPSGNGNRIFPATDIFKIRGIVSTDPYSRVAREEYAGAGGWRAAAK